MQTYLMCISIVISSKKNVLFCESESCGKVLNQTQNEQSSTKWTYVQDCFRSSKKRTWECKHSSFRLRSLTGGVQLGYCSSFSTAEKKYSGRTLRMSAQCNMPVGIRLCTIKVNSKLSGCETTEPKKNREHIITNPEACCTHGSMFYCNFDQKH